MKLKYLKNGGLLFKCPGCNRIHIIYYGEGNPPRWTWNYDLDKPTFRPSVKVIYPGNPDASEEFKEWRITRICHSFITNGNIQFLSDCTHNLKNTTVPLLEWEN